MKQPRLFLSYANKDDIVDVSDFFKVVTKRICSQKYIERSIPFKSSHRYPGIIQLPISYFVKEAFGILRSGNTNLVYRDILNANWERFSRSLGSYSFENTLPMVDISYAMIANDAEAFYAGIGMTILIAQKSSFGKRILALENKPIWVNLNDTDDFLSSVEKFAEIIRSQNNTAFSFERGADLVIQAMTESGFATKHMKLVLFSNGFFGNIEKYYKYMENQITLLGLSMPRLVFWNLSKIDICDIPSEKVLGNCVMLSGYSSSLLKYVATLKKEDCAYDVVERILNEERYDIFSNYILNLVQKSV
jgi:hypothetical protein